MQVLCEQVEESQSFSQEEQKAQPLPQYQTKSKTVSNTDMEFLFVLCKLSGNRKPSRSNSKNTKARSKDDSLARDRAKRK